MDLELYSGKKYELLLRYKFQHETINRYYIVTSPNFWQITLVKIILGAVILCLLLFSIYYFYQQKQKKEIIEQQNENEKTLLKLTAIRAQLNPHFIFNSLSSIQGLINTNEISSANKYLAEFSNLMRNTLVDGDKVFQNLDKEINILTTYLNLEQLRFKFEYRIEIDKTINETEIEIPSMLLQPMVENAIKHGVSELRENGKVYINFFRNGADLMAEIKDNGKGFNNTKITDGYGLKLTNDRIELLNKMISDQEIIKNIFRENDQTVVQVIFKNWL